MTGTDAGFLNSLVHIFDRTERTLLMLHYVEQLNVDEISQVLEISCDEVTEHLSSIRERTRAALAQLHPAAA